MKFSFQFSLILVFLIISNIINDVANECVDYHFSYINKSAYR